MKKFLTIFISLGLLVLMTIPFIVPANMLFPFITGKAFVFRIVTELIFAAWLILAIAYKEYRPKCTWLLRSVILLVFFLLISDLCAINVTKALWSNFERMEGWISFIHLLAYFIVLGSFLIRERDWLWFWRANTFIGFIVGIYVVFTAGADPRLSGPLGNPIYLGIYFLFILFTSLWLWLKDSILTEKPQINWTFYLYPIVPIFSLFITYRSSRGVFLGAIGGLCLTALLILIFERTQKVLRLSAGYFFSLIIVLVLIFIGVRHSTFVANNPTLSRLAEISWSNVNGQARQYVWPIALKGFKEHPVLGWGQEGFVYVFNKYYDPRMYNQETWFDRAHNSPLDFLVAGGLLSLLTYLSLYFFSIYYLWFRKNSLSVSERALWTGLLGGYLLQSLFVFDNLVSYLMFFAVIAYLHFLAEPQSNPFKRLNRDISTEYQNYIITPIIIIVIIGLGIFVNYRPIMANTTLIKAMAFVQYGQIQNGINSFNQALSYHSFGDPEIREQLMVYASKVASSAKIDLDLKKAIVSLAGTELKKQAALSPLEARYPLMTANFLSMFGDPGGALPYAEQAVALSPTKQASKFVLLRVYLLLNRQTEALALAKETYESAPDYDYAKKIYDSLLSPKTKVKN